MTTVGIRELKSKLSHYIKRAEAGERIVVTDHGRPSVVLAPAESEKAKDIDAVFQRLLNEGVITRIGKGKPHGSRNPLRLPGKLLSDIVIEGRDERIP